MTLTIWIMVIITLISYGLIFFSTMALIGILGYWLLIKAFEFIKSLFNK